MNTRVLIQPLVRIAANPALATAAPAYPPISAWDEDVGKPPHHVIKSHTIAPIKPPRMTVGSTIERSIKPLPSVFATAVPRPNAATKLKNAAHTTAVAGLKTRVDTIVAIEFALSWNPLMKSKMNATRTIARTNQTVADIRRA